MKQLTPIKIFESFMWHSRYILLLAVGFGILGAIMLVLLGCNEILVALTHIVKLVTALHVSNELERGIVTNIVTAIDTYLIATVLLIFSVGLYELFIKPLDSLADKKEEGHNVLSIHTLEQLKEKLAKVIIMVLIVTFFKFVVEIKFNNMQDLLYLSIGILLVALAVFFTHSSPSFQRKN